MTGGTPRSPNQSIVDGNLPPLAKGHRSLSDRSRGSDEGRESPPVRPSGGNRVPTPPSKSGEEALAGVHVLIAEDTPLLKKVAVIRMQKLGCTVRAVSDGKEALDAVVANYKAEVEGMPPDPNTQHFDAILMDCQVTDT